MYADFLSGDWTTSVVRHNKGEVPDTCDHRVLAISTTLGDRIAGMCVDIRYNSEILPFAKIPELREAERSNVDVADQAIGVEIVEVDRPHHTASTLVAGCKQEGPRFTASIEAPTTEFFDHLLPEI